MSEQHTFHHALQSRSQHTGELVAILVEEPLPSHVKPSGRLDFLLRPHPPRIQPSPAQATDLQLISTGTMRCLRLSAEHQRAANTAAKNTHSSFCEPGKEEKKGGIYDYIYYCIYYT
jgi:hypothetical protein